MADLLNKKGSSLASKMSIEIRYIRKYIRLNIFPFILFFALGVSIFLKSFFQVNSTLPCLFTSLFGIQCIGCGLTTASIELSHFHFMLAFDANPLVFIIIPLIGYFIVANYIKFRKRQLS